MFYASCFAIQACLAVSIHEWKVFWIGTKSVVVWVWNMCLRIWIKLRNMCVSPCFSSPLHIRTHTFGRRRVPSATDKSVVAQKNIENQSFAVPWMLFLFHLRWMFYPMQLLQVGTAHQKTFFFLTSLSGLWYHAHSIFDFLLYFTHHSSGVRKFHETTPRHQFDSLNLYRNKRQQKEWKRNLDAQRHLTLIVTVGEKK